MNPTSPKQALKQKTSTAAGGSITIPGLALSVKMALVSMMKELKGAVFYATEKEIGTPERVIEFEPTIEFGNSALSCLYGLYRMIAGRASKDTDQFNFAGAYVEATELEMKADTTVAFDGTTLAALAKGFQGTIKADKGQKSQTIRDGRLTGYIATDEVIKIILKALLTRKIWFDVPAYAQTINQVFGYFLKFVAEMDNAMNLAQNLNTGNNVFSFKKVNGELGKIMFPHMTLATARAEVRNALCKCTGIATDMFYVMHSKVKDKIFREFPLKVETFMKKELAINVLEVLSNSNATMSMKTDIVEMVLQLANINGINISTSFNFPPVWLLDMDLGKMSIFDFRGQGFWRVYKSFDGVKVNTYLPFENEEHAAMFLAMVITGLHYDDLRLMTRIFGTKQKIFSKKQVVDPMYKKKSVARVMLEFSMPKLVYFPKAREQVKNLGAGRVDYITSQLGSKVKNKRKSYISQACDKALAGGQFLAPSFSYSMQGINGTVVYNELLNLLNASQATCNPEDVIEVGTKEWYEASKLPSGYTRGEDKDLVAKLLPDLSKDDAYFWASGETYDSSSPIVGAASGGISLPAESFKRGPKGDKSKRLAPKVLKTTEEQPTSGSSSAAEYFDTEDMDQDVKQ